MTRWRLALEAMRVAVSGTSAVPSGHGAPPAYGAGWALARTFGRPSVAAITPPFARLAQHVFAT